MGEGHLCVGNCIIKLLGWSEHMGMLFQTYL